MKLLLLVTLVVFSLFTIAQIPDNRIVDWSNAGLVSDINLDIETVNVDDFGAIPNDGISDDQALQDAIDYFAGSPGKIQFHDGVYIFNTRIILESGIILEGGGSNSTILNANLDSEQDFIYASGSISAISYNVSKAEKGSSYIILQSALTEFSSGDIIKVKMDGESFMYSEWAYETMGQLFVIDNIVEDTIFLNSTLRHDFAPAYNPIAIKIEPVQNVLIKSLSIIREDATTTQTSNIRFTYAYNCQVRDIQSENSNFSHLSLRTSLNCEVSGCYFHHAHAYGEGGQGYGTEISASSGDCLIHNNIYEHLRHSVLIQSGANGNVIAYNYSFDPYWDQSGFPSASAGDLVLHGNYTFCNLFEGNIAQNVVIDDSHGQNGPYNTFFRNRLEKYGIVMNFNPATDSCNIIGNEITNTGFLLGNYTLFGDGHFEYGNNQTGDCKPSGTQNLEELSLFLENAPCYFYDDIEWPGIGYPVNYNAYVNPAYSRYGEGQMTFDTCETLISFITYDIIPENRFDIYPNPNNGSFYIEFNDEFEVSVFSLDGTLVQNKQTQTGSIFLKDVESGIYILQLRSDNYSENRKLVVN